MKTHLYESVPDIVYHTTTISNLLDIFKTNLFSLTSQFGGDADNQLDKGNYFFLSVSTVKFGGYALGRSSDNVVMIVLDGSKFNQRYKSRAVDYWGPEYKKDLTDTSRHRYDEEELRIYSKDGTIPNATSYIKEVHLNITNETIRLDASKAEDNFFDVLVNSPHYHILNTLMSYASAYSIPLYTYANFEAFKIQDKRKAYSKLKNYFTETFVVILKLYKGIPLTHEEYRENVSTLVNAISEIHRVMKYNPQKFDKEWLKNVFANPQTELPSLVYGVKDFITHLQNDLHNVKKEPSASSVRNEFVSLFSKKGYKDIYNIFELFYYRMKELYPSSDMKNLVMLIQGK